MFDTVLVANRGEIARRVIRTLHGLGIRSAAIYSDADRAAPHVQEADRAIHIGSGRSTESYLNISRIIDAARSVGAQAIHPGYGFLAENPDFARACRDVGMVFIGPSPEAIEAMADKIRAKQLVAQAGVRVVPGFGTVGMSDEEITVTAYRDVGLPLLIKPAAGGGGKGMRLVSRPEEALSAISGARREARAAFGDDGLLVERLIERPRHIEMQIVADGRGTIIHLGERECSLQRRHQKIIEEAPSPLLTAQQRDAMGSAAVAVARAVAYIGVGTVEFIVTGDRPDEFYFMEMNTRLQVEHAVTELVTGLDLVEVQVRIAAGELLPFRQVRRRGHAIEARVYAESPARGFLPSTGTVLRLVEPTGQRVRVDSGITEGTPVGTDYDPMLAKVVAWGPDRTAALRRLDRALADTVVLGVQTNVAFVRRLLADPDVAAGRLDTGLVERRLDRLGGDIVPAPVYVAAALLRLLALEPAGAVIDPFDLPTGWRVGEPAWTSWLLDAGAAEPVLVRVRGRAADAEVRVGDDAPVPASARLVGGELWLDHAGRSHRFSHARDGAVSWLGRDGMAWAVRERPRGLAAADDSLAPDGSVVAPMPGTVAAVHVAAGDAVSAGQALLVVEAMKMEHELRSPVAGIVADLTVQPGQSVAMEQVVAVVKPTEEA